MTPAKAVEIDLERRVSIRFAVLVSVGALLLSGAWTAAVAYTTVSGYDAKIDGVAGRVDGLETFRRTMEVDGRIPKAMNDELRGMIRETIFEALGDRKVRLPEASNASRQGGG